MTPTSFDGCGRRCRKNLAHTLVYGECEHAPPPEPTVSMSRVFTDTDGYPSIGFDTFTVQQLADLIEPALRRAAVRLGPNALAMLQRGETVGLSGGEYADLAREAAHAIVHRGDEPETAADTIRDAWEEARDEAEAELRRLADETPHTQTHTVDLPTLAAALDGLHTLIATSSRDWGQYRVDAWIWAVLCGWDCEDATHTDTCVHGALEEQAARHGWDADTVAKARRYRAAVRAVTEAAAVLPEPAPTTNHADEAQAETPLEKRLRFSERRNDELRTECKRRGKRVLEQHERIIALERQVDEVQRQLGAEILRAGQAEAELRRLADETPHTQTHTWQQEWDSRPIGADVSDLVEIAPVVSCSGTLHSEHPPHDWEPQPGMDPVHCPGDRKPAVGARQDGTET
ncbi:hypothetical protein ACPCAJ_01960 [Streptomyces griseoincarnatus]